MCKQPEKTYRLEVCRCACRSWFCDRCAVRMGLTVRNRLELIMRTTGWVPFMITLTANPAWFSNPEEAFWFMRSCINNLVTELWRRNEGRRSDVCWMLSKRY